MLRRYQVLLPDWLEEYFKKGVEIYGFSFSEIIRLQICFSILAQIPAMHPEYKPKLLQISRDSDPSVSHWIILVYLSK